MKRTLRIVKPTDDGLVVTPPAPWKRRCMT